MSDLAGKIQSDLVAAMKNKDELKLSVLRMLKSAMQLAQVEKGKENALTDDDVLVLVSRLIKQRVEAAEMYKSGGAADRAERELAEAQVLEIYQPAQLSDEDILKIVAKVAEETGAAGPKDMGKMMGKTMAAVKGQADGNRVKSAVQHYLNQLVQ
ncbi:GatB/YqeY domain-containing protein [Cloacibacillus evryensis]|uniref:GatB/YqeY domain-containing protein n=1 Tax=Cloacibacillus evryensis TaxID=508460 RepID=UPI00241D16A7|nr:GatB/YqeY domain-containing protein [Cloacibacillus evryensis]